MVPSPARPSSPAPARPGPAGGRPRAIWLLPWLALGLGLGLAGCGPGSPCDGVSTSCLALDLTSDAITDGAAGATVTGVTIELRGAFSGRQVVAEPVQLPAGIEVELPDVSGLIDVLVLAQSGAGGALSGAASAIAVPGQRSLVPIRLRPASEDDTACGTLCPLGCNVTERRCYAPRPSNLPAPRGTYFAEPTPAAIEITGTAYLDTVTCQLSDGLNPLFPGRYRGQLADQGRGPPVCVIGLTGLAVLAEGRLVVYSSNDSPSTPAAAILSLGDIRVAGTIDARGCLRDRQAGHGAGPGGYWGAHDANYSQVDTCGGGDGDDSGGLRPGGGGGGHGSAGGRGGSPNAMSAGGRGGLASAGGEPLTPLRGGCGGGFAGGSMPPGEGGGGGGALQLWAAGTVEIADGGAVDVSGCGARAAGAGTGGAGGGAGGGILVEAGILTGGGTLAAFGGGGAGTGASGAPGDARGGGAGGKPQTGPAGGRGAGDLASLSQGVVATEGGLVGGNSATLGGGGGGGLGRVRLNVAQRSGFTGAIGAALSAAMPLRD